MIPPIINVVLTTISMGLIYFIARRNWWSENSDNSKCFMDSLTITNDV